MKHRKWTSKQKSQIVIEGISGRIEISKLCGKYEISQTQYYKWRDQFLQTCHQAFETKNITKKKQKLKSENQKLKSIIGDLTVELKKTNSSIKASAFFIRITARSGSINADSKHQARTSLLGLSQRMVLLEMPNELSHRN